MDGGELRHFGHSWWCRGGGAAVLMLLVVVSVFRAPRDLIFWAAVAFFAGHTSMAVLRYLRERKARSTATVIRHHTTHVGPAPAYGGMVFSPPPPNSILIPLKITVKDLGQQTKNTV